MLDSASSNISLLDGPAIKLIFLFGQLLGQQVQFATLYLIVAFLF